MTIIQLSRDIPWCDRLKTAQQRGRFTMTDYAHASDMLVNPIGEIGKVHWVAVEWPNGQGLYRGIDQEWERRGTEFVQAVDRHDITAAWRIWQNIQDAGTVVDKPYQPMRI